MKGKVDETNVFQTRKDDNIKSWASNGSGI